MPLGLLCCPPTLLSRSRGGSVLLEITPATIILPPRDCFFFFFVVGSSHCTQQIFLLFLAQTHQNRNFFRDCLQIMGLKKDLCSSCCLADRGRRKRERVMGDGGENASGVCRLWIWGRGLPQKLVYMKSFLVLLFFWLFQRFTINLFRVWNVYS